MVSAGVRPGGRHLLCSRSLAEEIVRDAGIGSGELVVDVGAGTGLLTRALLDAGAQVVAVEPDPRSAARLRRSCPAARVVEAPAASVEWPIRPFRVVANLPFNVSAEICRALLGDPSLPLRSADLIVEWDLAAKRARLWPSTLAGVVWGAWYELSIARRLPPELSCRAHRRRAASSVRRGALRRSSIPRRPSPSNDSFAAASRGVGGTSTRMGGRGASGSTAAGTSVRARNVVSVIARLRGRVAGRAGGGLVVDVNGVGYLVHAAPSVQRLGGGEITIEIHTIVREDALQLYGFASSEERELFELLLGVSGVGPKVALAIVSGSTPAELRRAIARDDVKRFQAIPGVGLKTAQRVVLDLKEKLSVVDALAPDADDATLARDALVNLGWSLLDAERVLASVDAALPVEEQVREALRAAA